MKGITVSTDQWPGDSVKDTVALQKFIICTILVNLNIQAQETCEITQFSTHV